MAFEKVLGGKIGIIIGAKKSKDEENSLAQSRMDGWPFSNRVNMAGEADHSLTSRIGQDVPQFHIGGRRAVF